MRVNKVTISQRADKLKNCLRRNKMAYFLSLFSLLSLALATTLLDSSYSLSFAKGQCFLIRLKKPFLNNFFSYN